MLSSLLVKNDRRVKTRQGYYGKQYDADTILNLLVSRVPKDAYAMIAVTNFDLYGSKWNFLYGLARLKQRVGVFSFARYDPHFWGDGEEMK